MTTIRTTGSLASDIRVEIQDAAANRTGLDYKAIIARIEADDLVSADELGAVQHALTAELAAGTIDRAKAQRLMGVIAGRLYNRGSVDDRATIRAAVTSFVSLGLTDAQLSAAADAAQRSVDRGLLAKEMRSVGADGIIIGPELARLWQAAHGSDGKVSVGEVRAIYRTIDGMLKAGAIDAKQHAALTARMDAALTARLNFEEVSANAGDYIRAIEATHAADDASTDAPTAPATWLRTLETVEAATEDRSSGRKLSAGAVVAFADMVRTAAAPVSDEVARAVASALDTAVSAGKITAADARSIAGILDRRIAQQRHGIAASSDFHLVLEAMTTRGAHDDGATAGGA